MLGEPSEQDKCRSPTADQVRLSFSCYLRLIYNFKNYESRCIELFAVILHVMKHNNQFSFALFLTIHKNCKEVKS